MPAVGAFRRSASSQLGISTRDVAVLKNQIDLPVGDGTVVWQVAAGGPAATPVSAALLRPKMGMSKLETLCRYRSEKVDNADDLYRILDKHQFGDTIQLQIIRNVAEPAFLYA